MTDPAKNDASVDPNALILQVVREAYVQATEDLRSQAEKMRRLNEKKKAVREYLSSLRDLNASVLSAARERGVDLCRGDAKDAATLAELFDKHARTYDVGELEYELCIPNRVPREGVSSFPSLDNEIARWEEKLNAIGDDAQLASVDLQNTLQKQQQALQMMSNIAKAHHDTVMSVIRNLKA